MINIRNKKYGCNENYFENIDNQEKAYFLGFMYADGCVLKKRNFCRITQKKDKYILEKFRSLLQYNGPITLDKRRTSFRLNITSKKMKQDLIDKGCIPQKTFKLEFPHWLREDLKQHFIRGYLDGDGSITVYRPNFKTKNKYLRVTIAGRKDFLRSILDISGIRGHIRRSKNQRIYHLRFYSSFAIVFSIWLYKNCTICLERKRRKYLNYLKRKKE